jgi:hypothetical protein
VATSNASMSKLAAEKCRARSQELAVSLVPVFAINAARRPMTLRACSRSLPISSSVTDADSPVDPATTTPEVPLAR